MVWGYLLNAPLAILMVITYCFSISTASDALDWTYPFIRVFHRALGEPGATTTFLVVMLVLLSMITISVLALAARQTVAFAYVTPSLLCGAVVLVTSLAAVFWKFDMSVGQQSCDPPSSYGSQPVAMSV